MTATSAGWALRTTPPELEAQWLAEGLWDDHTLGQLLDGGLSTHAEVEYRVHSGTRPWHGTFADVHERARKLAKGLSDRGIGAGDAVAFQLPNSVEAAVVFYAAAFLGAVVVPIVHFYGPKEVGYILGRTGVRVFITIDRFGWIDYLDAMSWMGDELAAVDVVAVIGIDAPRPEPVPLVPFDDLFATEPLVEPIEVDPRSPALVAYTSGTTSEPKGVIHSHRTVGAEVRQLGALAPEGQPPPLIGLPVGHAMGMLGALLIPVLVGRPIHLVDVWDPPELLRLMTEHGLSCGSGATFFLTSLLDHPDLTDDHLELMRFVGLGGSAVPAAVAERATGEGISIVRMYGSTEHPSITGGTHDDPLDKRVHTDGSPLHGVEIRLVDDAGVDVAVGEPGEILSRGPECCMGYTDPAVTVTAFDDDGWFHTGDVGVLDEDGYLRITDRKKDVIIRGGENVSAAEVEEVVAWIPGVLEVAVVAGPDARLGERVCAFVRVDPDSDVHPVDLDTVRAAAAAAGSSRQKRPEDVRVVDDLPRTPSGKVQKVVLRDRLRAEVAGVTGAMFDDHDRAVVDRLLSTTRAVRRRLDVDRPVEREVILECLRLAVQAPTASNEQNWRWLVVTDPDRRAAVAELYRSSGAAYLAKKATTATEPQARRTYESAFRLTEILDRVPVLVIPCIEARCENMPNVVVSSTYASIIPAAWSFMLALRSRGLGSVWTTLHLARERDAAELLGIPDGVTQVGMLPVAYTTGGDFRPASRPPVETVTHWETWEG